MKVALVGDSLTEGRPGVSFAEILKKRFPAISFDNLGKPGETIKSLHKRLTKSGWTSEYDLIFLWIGVNDVYTKLLNIQAQPVVEDEIEFQMYYEKVVKLCLAVSPKVVVVTPALVGENLNSQANQQVKQLAAIIESIANQHGEVCFLNLQRVFEEQLSNLSSSDYISTKVMRVMKDTLFYKSPTKIDQLSAKRGLHFTLDGVHFNRKGAEIVANEYGAVIESQRD